MHIDIVIGEDGVVRPSENYTFRVPPGRYNAALSLAEPEDEPAVTCGEHLWKLLSTSREHNSDGLRNLSLYECHLLCLRCLASKVHWAPMVSYPGDSIRMNKEFLNPS